MCAFSKIQYCKREELDEQKWNACIENSKYGLIYSYSFYLDALCDNWDALIIEGYKAVMPLPWRKKWGIHYLYAPPFIQQLGITGDYSTTIYPEVLEIIKKHFKYGDLLFNYSNTHLPVVSSQKTNFVLPLDKSYEELSSKFSNDLKKNLKGAEDDNFILSAAHSHHIAIKLFQESYRERMPHVTTQDFQKFSVLCNDLKEKNMLLTRTITNNKEEVLATVLLLRDGKRIYNLMNTTTATGRKERANHYLLHRIIKEFSNSSLVFDFEGSDLPGVKEFYQNFKPINQSFYHYHFNHLPFPLNLVKK